MAPLAGRSCLVRFVGVDGNDTVGDGRRAGRVSDRLTVVETYRAQADRGRAELLAASGPFTIELRFQGGLRPGLREAFVAAADRWTRVIVGSLPPVVVDGETIEDLVITADARPIDGAGGICGRPAPGRPPTSRRGA
jgi:hypothetical protein